MAITTNIIKTGVGGTFTFTVFNGRKTGTSDPIPNTCTAGQATAGYLLASKRAGIIIPPSKLTPAVNAAIAQAVTAVRNRK
jgi:hypothetical protein